jgi:hypothetical protein
VNGGNKRASSRFAVSGCGHGVQLATPAQIVSDLGVTLSKRILLPAIGPITLDC